MVLLAAIVRVPAFATPELASIVPVASKASELVASYGGTVTMPPHQVPTGDWIVLGTDPQGAAFALVGGQ